MEGYDNYSVYSRLAAYEDTGLTPGDVKDLQGLCKEKGLYEYGDLIIESKWELTKANEMSMEQDERIEQLEAELDEYRQKIADGRMAEVVRCGKCRHYNTTGCSDGCGWCENMYRGVFDEHYCSRGERREKE
jgi:predicted RNA-binding protein